jgi:adenine phosphoribosyltransferase
MLPDIDLRTHIRAIPDFPQPGIIFRDITPLLHEPAAFRSANEQLAEIARSFDTTLIAGIEARGFLFGAPVAEHLNLPFVPIRKPGKLPADHASVSYELEYGHNSLELHLNPSIDGHRVVIVDDLLATGGTAAAAGQLVEELGGIIAGYTFVIELDTLAGRARLDGYSIQALLHY